MSQFGYVGWRDTTGTALGFKNVDGMPRVCNQTYLQQIAEGNVSGHTMWSKIGYNPAISTTEEDVWSAGGKYVFPTEATAMEVVSSSAGDEDLGTIIHSGGATGAGGSTTTISVAGENFLTTTAVGDLVILDKAGTTPEWAYVTAVTSDTVLTFAGGLSSGGTGAGRTTYHIIDVSAKTGCHAVKIEYLDPDYSAHSEIVILDGNAAVDLVNSPFRINSFRAISCGTALSCVGNLTLQANGAGTVYSYIALGYTRARNIIYTVPAGKTLYIVSWAGAYGTSGSPNREFCRLYTRANVEPATKFKSNIFYAYTEMMALNSTVFIPFDMPTSLPAGTDLMVSAVASATGAVTTVLRGWLE